MGEQGLENEVSRHKAEAQEAIARQQAASARVELLQRELEEAQCSLSSYCKAVETAKIETMELQAQLDAVTMDNVNEEGKGNSLSFMPSVTIECPTVIAAMSAGAGREHWVRFQECGGYPFE